MADLGVQDILDGMTPEDRARVEMRNGVPYLDGTSLVAPPVALDDIVTGNKGEGDKGSSDKFNAPTEAVGSATGAPDFSEGSSKEEQDAKGYIQGLAPLDRNPFTENQPRTPDNTSGGMFPPGGQYARPDPNSDGVYDPTRTVQTGIGKGFFSGVPQLYGLAGAATDYAMNKAQGGDKTFAETMFRPGGMQEVQQEAENFKQDYAKANPDASIDDFLNAFDAHRATPEYYNFLADQMRDGISSGMKNAMDINRSAGIKETPEGQSTLEQISEGIFSAMVPVADVGAITKMASNITSRVGPSARFAGKVASTAVNAVLPGSSSGTGLAVGTGLAIAGPSAAALAKSKPHGAAQVDPNNIVLSPGMTDPRNGQPVTSRATMAEPIENAHQDVAPSPLDAPVGGAPLPSGQSLGNANGPAASPAPQPQQAVPTIQQGPMPQQQSNSKVQQVHGIEQGALPGPAGAIGGALALVGGTALAIKGGKYIGSAIQRARGALPVNVDAFKGQPTKFSEVIPPNRIGRDGGIILDPIPGAPTVPGAIARDDKINASTAIRGNLKPNTNGTLPERVLKAFSNAINKDTYAEAEAREVGGNPLERIIQSELGTKLSKDAKAADMGRIMEHGVMPNGTVMRTNPADFMNLSKSMTQDQRSSFVRLMQGLNVMQRREEAWTRLLNRQQELQQLIQNSRSPNAVSEATQELGNVSAAMSANRAGQPNSRITFTQVPTDTLRYNIGEGRRDPQVRQLEQMFRDISQDLIEYEHSTGSISSATALNFSRNAHYMPLFEFKDVKKNNTSPHMDATDIPETEASPERAIDPWSAITFKVYGAVNRGNTNAAHTRIINAFRAADPNARAVRPVDSQGHGTITIRNAGEEEHYQFARPDVANSLKAQPLDMPIALRWANAPRTLAQRFITGPLAGSLYTPIRSVTFDLFSTQATMQEGRVFGMGGALVNRLSPQSQQLAQKISSVDPTAALVSVGGGLEAGLQHAYRAAGDKIREMAVKQSPLWNAVGQLPGGQQFLTNMGARLTHAYDSSAIAVLERSNGIQMHQMLRDTLMVRNELEGMMRGTQNAGRSGTAAARATVDPTWGAIKSLYQNYAGAINLIHNASRYGFWLQNYALLERNAARAGRSVTEEEVRTLAEEVRRSAGDLAGQPGHRLTQTTAALIAYENISLQTMRHVFKATIRDPMQVGLTTTGLATSAYLSYRSVVDRGPEAENWYWNRANPWERIGAIRNIPKPQTIEYMATHGGSLPPWDPNDPQGDHYDIAMSPEFLPLVTMYMAGLEATGLIKRPNDATTFKSDLGFSLSDALAMGTIPAINVPLIALTGQRLNMTAGMQGRAALQGPQTSYGSGITSGETMGGLPFTVPMMATEVLGLAGTMAAQAVDQGLNAYNQGHSLGDSLNRAAAEAEDYIKERPAIPDIPGLYNAPTKVYRSTPAMRLAYQRNQLAMGSKGNPSPLSKQWSLEFGKDKPTSSEGMQAPRIMDHEVLSMLQDVHNAYSRVGDIKDARSGVGYARSDANQIDKNKRKYTMADIASGKFRKDRQDALLEMQSEGDKFMQATEDFQKRFGVTYADRFNKEGLPATLEGLETLVKRTARHLQPGEQPLSFSMPRAGTKKPRH